VEQSSSIQPQLPSAKGALYNSLGQAAPGQAQSKSLED
jgi:hypothetical protein